MKKKVIIAVAALAVSAVAIAGLSMKETSQTKDTPSASKKGSTEFVKTNAKCRRTNVCDCSGYWGYIHYPSRKYEGRCQNSDGHGHTCGHSPADHGLPQW